MKLIIGALLAFLVNQERALFSLPPVAYNASLHRELQKFQDTVTNDSWFYEIGPQATNFTSNGVTRINNLRGSFVRVQGSRYLFRDTFYKSVPIIFRHRARQRDCFNWAKCSNTTFNLFTSCMKDPIIFADGYPCSWAYAYYGVFVQRSLRSFACLDLYAQGRFVPDNLVNKQMRSFWCYGYPRVPVSDNPFLN